MFVIFILSFSNFPQKAAYDYEHSELLLYQNLVLQESGDASAALAHLQQYKEQICDRAAFLEARGDLLLRLDRHPEAEEAFAELIRRNPECHAHYRRMEEAARREGASDKLEMYAGYREKYPRAQAPQRIPLDIAEGECGNESNFPSLVAKK